MLLPLFSRRRQRGHAGSRFAYRPGQLRLNADTRSGQVPTFAFFLAIRLLIVEPRYIPSLSMFPTLDINDQLAVEKISKYQHPPRRGEIVVFDPPELFWKVTSAPPVLARARMHVIRAQHWPPEP